MSRVDWLVRAAVGAMVAVLLASGLVPVASHLPVLGTEPASAQTQQTRAGVSLVESGGSTQVTEAAGAGRTDTYTVVLSSRPSADVVITPTASSTRVTTSGAVTIAPADWNQPVTMQVTAADDDRDNTAADLAATITHTVASTDPAYAGAAVAAVDVTIVDDDVAGITVTHNTGTILVTEAPGAGRTDTFTVVLDSQPHGEVVVDAIVVASSAVAVQGPTGPAGARAILRFTPADWDQPQTVTVTGLDDSIDQGLSRIIAVELLPESDDPDYHGDPAAVTVPVTVVDDDSAGVTVAETAGSTQVTDDGSTDAYTVQLGSDPGAGVTVTVVATSSTPAAALVSVDGSAPAASATLTFTGGPAGTWRFAETVTVTGVADDLDNASVDSRPVSITHAATASSTANAYHSIAVAPVAVTVLDDDPDVGVTLTETGGSTQVDEDRGIDTYTAALASKPTHDVTIDVRTTSSALRVAGPGDLTAGTSTTLTFTSSNWDQPQTVEVTGRNDDIDNGAGRSATVTHTARSVSDQRYNNLAGPTLAVTVLDDEAPDLRLTHTDGYTAVAENSAHHLYTDRYEVRLGTPPASGSTVNLGVSVDPGAPLKLYEVGSDGNRIDTELVNAGSAAFTWNSSNWETPITIEVEGFLYSLVSGNTQWVISNVAAAGGTSDGDPYHGGTVAADLDVTLIDNSAAGVTILPTDEATTVDETGAGNTDSYDVLLNTNPGRNVAVIAASQDTGAVRLFDRNSALADERGLAFTSTNWDEPQTVTLQGQDDGSVNNGGQRTASISYRVVPNGGVGDYAAAGVVPGDTSVTVVDTDVPAPGVLIKASSRSPSSIPEATPSTVDLSAELPLGSPTFDYSRPVQIRATVSAAPRVTAAAVNRFTLLIPAGARSSQVQSMRISPVVDSDDQPDGSVTFTHGDVTGWLTVSAPLEFPLIDGDPTVATLTADALTVAENGGTSSVLVTLGQTVPDHMSVVVPLTVTGAVEGEHYTLGLRPGAALNVGVSMDVEAPHSPQNPALHFAAGARIASLVLTAAPNSDLDERTVQIAHGAGSRSMSVTGSGGGATAAGGPISVAITNDDSPFVKLAEGADVAEGADAEFTLNVLPAPASDMTVHVTVSQSGAGAGAGPTTGTTTRTDTIVVPAGATSRQFTVSTSGDMHDDPAGRVSVTVEDRPEYTVAGLRSPTVSVADDDSTEVTLVGRFTDADGDQQVVWPEGAVAGTREIDLTLGRALDAGEVLEVPLLVQGATAGEHFLLALAPGTPAGVTLSGTSVTFTGSAGSTVTGATLAVTLLHDDDALDETVVISLPPQWPSAAVPSPATTLGGGAAGSGSLSFRILDDDRPAAPGVVVSAERVRLTEGGGADDYHVWLGADPGDGITVTVTPMSGDTSAATVSAALTFTGGPAGDWAMAQAVTVTPVDDPDDDHERVVVSHAVAGYPGVRAGPNVIVVVTDDDDATASGLVLLPDELPANGFAGGLTQQVELVPQGVVFSGGSTGNIGEGQWTAATGELTAEGLEHITLTGAPSGLTIASARLVATRDDTVGGMGTGADPTDTDAVVEFAYSGTPINADTAVTVTVGGALLSRVGSMGLPEPCDGGECAAISATLTILATTPAVVVRPDAVELTEGGDAGSYQVVLSTDPGSGNPVTVTAASGDTAAVTVAPTVLTFTGGDAGTWKTARTVTVTPVDDADADAESVTVTHAVAGYPGVTAAPSVAVTVADDDVPEAAVTETEGSTEVTEAGAGNTDTYTVVLRSRPTADVTVTLTSDDPAAATVQTTGAAGASATLTFTTGNWATAQTVRVTGVADAVDEPGGSRQAKISHTFAGGGYGAVKVGNVIVSVVDDDPTVASLAIGSTSTLVEGDASVEAEVTVTLSRALVAGETVEVPLSLASSTGAAVDGGSPHIAVALKPAQTGAALSGAATATPVLTLTGRSGASVESGVVTISAAAGVDDGDTDPESLTVSLGNQAAFSGRATTNLAGGAEPHTSENSAALTIVDDDDTTLSVTLARTDSGALTEGASAVGDRQAVITVTLGRALVAIESYTVPLAITGDGVAAADFTLAAAPGLNMNTGVALASEDTLTPAVTFAGVGARTATLLLTVADDTIDEPGETLEIALGPLPTPLTDAGDTDRDGTIDSGETATSASVELTDDDATTVELAGTDATVVENAGTAEFTVELGRALVAGETVAAPLVVSGAGVAADDFALSRKTGGSLNTGVTLSTTDELAPVVTFTGAGAQTATLVFTATQDTVYEGASETAKITLGDLAASATNVAGGAEAFDDNDPVTDDNEVEFTITDDDSAPTAQFGSATYSAGEASGSRTASVEVSLSPAPLSGTVNISIAATGTAVFGTDYAALGPVFVGTSGTATITVTVIDDDIDEVDETVVLSIGPSLTADYVPGSVSSTTVTVTDNDALPTATLALSPSSISEAASGTVSVTASLSHPSDTDVTLTVDKSGPAATLSTTKVLTITAGQTASTGAVELDPVDNSTDEADRTVTVTAAASGGRGVAAPAPVTLAVTDDDALPTATLALSQASISEAASGTVSVTASLSHPSDTDVTLTVDKSGAAATLSNNKVLTIAAGQTASTGAVELDPVDNSTDEADRTVTVTATASGGRGVGNPAPVTLTVTDDDDPGTGPTAQFGSATYSAGEASGSRTASVEVSLSPAPSGTVNVQYTVTGTAGSPADYASLSGSVGIGSSGSATITVTVADDTIDEADETVILTITDTADYNLGAVSSTTVTITDDDALPTATLALSQASISEAASGTVSVTASLSHPSDTGVTLTVAKSGPAATLSNNKVLTIAAGQTASTGAVELDPVDNSTDEADRTVTVTATASGGRGVGHPAPVTLTVTDDDDPGTGPAAQFGSATYSAGEASGSRTASVEVSLSPAPSGAVNVSYTVTGTADSPADYASLSGSVSVGSSGTATITVTVIDDTIDEADETVVLTITDGADYNLGSVSSTTVTVTDDDALPTATLALSAATVAENGSPVWVTASLSHPSDTDVTLTVAKSGAGASLSTTKVLTIAAGQTHSSGEVLLTPVDDSVDNPDRTVTVTAAASGGRGVANPASATLTVTDNDSGGDMDIGRMEMLPGLVVDAEEGVVFLREGETAVLRLTLDFEVTAPVPVTATSSDPSRFKVNHPRFLHMGAHVVGSSIRGRLVQTTVTPPASPGAPVQYRAPSASIDFSFDEQDWAGYTSEANPSLHKGYRYVVITAAWPVKVPNAQGHLVPVDLGPDRVFDLTFTSTDTSVSGLLPAVKVVIGRRNGGMDPLFSPDPRFDAGCRYGECLRVDEGGETTYTVTNRIVPRPGKPLTIAPIAPAGSGITFDPPAVSWTGVDDYDEVRTITVRAAHDADRRNEEVTIRHVFSDSWATNGYLTDRTAQFNMALTVVDDDKLDFAVYEPDSDTRLTALEINSSADGTSAFDIRINRDPLDTETLYIKLQTGNGRNRAPFAATVDGEVGRRGGYYFWHKVTPANWNQPIRVKLTMADQIGGAGSYDLGLALTRGHQTVRRTVPVSYSPTAMGFIADESIVKGLDGPQEQDQPQDQDQDQPQDQEQDQDQQQDQDQDQPQDQEQDQQQGRGYTVDPGVVARVRALAAQVQHGPDHVNRWNRVLVAFGEHDGTGVTGGPTTLAEAEQNAGMYSSPVWNEVVAELTKLAADPP